MLVTAHLLVIHYLPCFKPMMTGPLSGILQTSPMSFMLQNLFSKIARFLIGHTSKILFQRRDKCLYFDHNSLIR